MQNWILFPESPKQKNFSGQESLEMLLFLLQGNSHYMITREEWHTLIPESREKLRKPSLGFCCGDLSGKSGSPRELLQGLPPVPVRKYTGEYQILPKAWNNDFSCTIRNPWGELPQWILRPDRRQITLTVPGALLLEQSFFVYGSRNTRFSKYRIRPLPAETFAVGGKKR